MKKCYLYGNCFMKVLKRYLDEIDVFDYNVEYFYIIDSIEKVDLQFIKECDLFIYQSISKEAICKINGQVDGYDTCSILKVLKNDCKSIQIPSFYFNGYFIDGINHDSELFKSKIKSNKELFPNYCFNNLLFNLIFTKLKCTDILKLLDNQELYSKEEILYNLSVSINNLRSREHKNKVDIPISEFILLNYKNKRLFHTTSHPSKYIFEYIINEIFKILGIKNNIELSEDYMETNQKIPILECVKRHLQLTFVDNDRYFIQGKEFTKIDYINFYLKK